MLSSPRLIPKWKDLKLLINNILQDIKVDGKRKNDTVVLSDWPETLYREPHHPQNKPFICFYSININYFVSLNWMEPYSKQMQAILWIQKKNTEMEGMIEKMKFHIMDQVPPIQTMVHTGSYHMLIAYCGDMRLWLFRDHHQAFTYLGTVPCRFSVSCLCYDSRTEILLSGTLGAVVTWFILPNGRGLQMAQTVPMLGHELVQGFSLNGPQGSLLALCENKVRVFTDQGQGQLQEVKNFTPIASGSSITCSFVCVSQGYFYAGNRDGEIHAWGLDRGNFLHSFQAHSSSVICVHSRPETHTLLTAGSEGVVREWNLAFGNLLRQLNIDEGLQQLQFIDNNTFFCQTTNTFLLYNLPCFYSLFNVCGSALQQVQRVCCGRNWTRILCATKDGLVRFLSPVTGELLVITWPLLVTDKALVWAYDSDREELFVATDSSEVLVFDATRSPCTAKYLVCTSLTRGDRVRCLAYAQSHLRKGLVGLMFCGHESGIVRILSHYSCARIEKTVHSGAVLALSTLEGPQKNSLLCSYGMDNTVQLTEAVLQENKVILQPISKILCNCPLKHVILLPGSVAAITENHCWCLWHYKDFLTSSESNQSCMFKETKCLHHCAITSFDVCLSLKLFVTGGIDGSVRIWDFHGRLITKLDSALHFGPLCFANNRGDLLLAFNQSLYLVSCLKLLSPAQLIHLAVLNNADEIQEVPKPFLPSFFFSFEIVFIPKFVYLGQGLQELQGLEALVNKRAIAFDNTVPHVVEEERHTSSVIQKEPKLHFLEDKDVDFSTLHPRQNHPPYSVPAQLRLAGWDGLNPYHILRCFFGKGRQWPFAPDGYIPNSVVRARLWPEGTPIFLLCDLYTPYQNKDWNGIELFRHQAWSPMTLVKEKISSSKQDKSKKRKHTFFDVLVNMANLNWIGRKFDEGLINNLIETILNHTVYCSVEQYEIYTSVLAQIFATYQVSPSLYSETACRLLEDTTHPNPRIRELAWEGLERLGLMSPLFAIPLAMGLMDRNENVRAKTLNLMIRVTGIQTKTMLVSLMKKREIFRDMQQEFIGETSLDQLLGIQASDIQYLLSQVEQQLNENLMLSCRDQQFTFSSDISKAGELEALAEQTLILLSEPEKITTPKKRVAYVQSKSRNLIEKDLRVPRKQKQTEFVKFSSVLVPSKDEGEQTEARRSEQIDTQDAAVEPELPLRAFSPVKSQEDAESKEITLDIMEAMGAIEVMEATEAMGVREAVEATVVVEAMEKHGREDYKEMTPKLERQKHMKRLWKRAMKKSRDKADMKLEEKKELKGTSKITAEEPKEEVIEIPEQENDTKKKVEKSGRGLAGTPGRIGRSDTRCWRDDICSLATSRIASSHPGMVRDLSQELVDLAQAVLAPRQPSWDIFQEICPLLKDSSELYHKVVEEQPIITEKVVKEVVKEEGTIEPREQGEKKVVKKGKAFSQVKKKKIAFLKDHLVLEKRKLEKEVRKLDRQDRKIAKEKKKLSKPEKKLMQKKEKLTKDKETLTHEKEKIAWEEEILASSQKKLTREEQKLVLGEKEQTGKEGKLLGATKSVTWKEGEATSGREKWDWEESVLAQEEGMWTQEERLLIWEERKLSQEEEKADEGEEKPGVDKKLGEEEKPGEGEEKEQGEGEEEELGKGEEELGEEEKPGEEEEEELREGEEELGEEEKPGEEEEEELREGEQELGEEEKLGEGEEEEELAWDEKELILYLEKQVEERKKKPHKKKKYILGVEKHVKEEAWKTGKLAQEEEHLFSKEEGLSGELGKWTLKKGSLAEQEIQLTQEKKKWFLKEKKEAHKKEQIQEKEKQIEKQEKDQKERQAKKVEKEAKDKQLVWKRKKLGLGEEKFGEMKILSQEDKQTQKKVKRAWEKERRAQDKEETVKKRQQAWGKKEVGLREEEQAREMEKWSQKEKKQVWAKNRQDQKEEKLAGKVEKEAVEKTRQTTEKVKPVPEEEKKMKETGEVSPEEEKQVMKKEKEAKIEEKWIGKDKTTEEKKQWSLEKGQLALQEEKQAQKGRIWGQKEEKDSKKKEEWTWEKEKLSLEEEEQVGEKEKKSQEEEERELEKRLTKKVRKLAKEERHISEKEKEKLIEGIDITKRKKEITQEEKELMKKEGKLSQEERQLAYKRTKETGVAKRKKKRTKEEGTQATRKLVMERKISSEGKEAIFRGKDLRKNESHLLRLLAKTIREISTVPLEKIKIPEEERSSIVGKSEIDGQRWEILREQEEITKEEKELDQKERTLEGDRLPTKERTLTDEESLEEDRRLLEKVQETISLDKIQVESMLKEIQEQNILGKRQLKKLRKRIENEPKKIPVKWLLGIIRDMLFEGLSESLTEKETEEGPTEKGKEEENLSKDEEGSLSERKEGEEEEENLEEEKEEEEASLEEEKESLTEEEEEETLAEEEEESLEEESLEEKILEEEEEEEEEEESLEEEKESLIEEESLEEEEEEILEEQEEEEEEEILEEEKESLSEEESSSEKEEEEMEKVEKKEEEGEEKEERQKDEGSLSKEKQEESMLSQEERVLKTELSKEGVSFSQLVKESVILAEEREGTARSEVPFKEERLLDGKRDPTFMDMSIWPTYPKSPFKIPLMVALGKKEGMPLKILGDLEKQESQLGAHPMTSSWGKQEDVLLEKSRGIFSPAMEIGLETQIPEGLHRPGFPLPDLIIKPQKPKHRPKGGKWKWFLKYWDSSKGKTEGQGPSPALAPALAPAPAPALAPSFMSMSAKRPGYSEASFSDEDWVNNALIRLKSGEKLTRDSVHRLSQLLRDFTSKGYLKRMHLSNLKAIAKHFRQILEVSNTDIPQPYKDILSPLHLKVIPPARRKEKESCLEPFPIREAVLPSATRTQTPQALKWHLLAESYRKKQAQQLSTAVKGIKHIYPIRKDKKSLAFIFQKDFWASRERDEFPKFHKAKKKSLPIPAPALPPTTKISQVPTTINWHLLGEPYRSVRVQQLSSALKEMEMRHFSPAPREIFTGAHASVDKQTLALMFQKDLRAFKGKGRLPKLPQLEKKAKPDSKEKEEVPLWETFVALYHVLRMLQERYGEDSATWMEQFYQLMDLYQVKSPGIQRLLLELLQRKELQPQETIYKKALKTKELALGERLFYGLFCGSSHAPAGPIKFQDVVPLSGQNKVHSIQPVGIAHYGFLELAWKSLPQVNPYLTKKLPTIHTPTPIWPNVSTLGSY